MTTDPTKIGSYRGFNMIISFDSFNKEFNIAMKGDMMHMMVLGKDVSGNVTDQQRL